MIAARSHVYSAFGLRIWSELPLPELPAAADRASGAEAEIRYADLSAMLAELERDRFAFREGRLLFRIPHAAVFAIESGCRILVMPLQGADERLIRLYVLGTCMGALLLQRGMLPLHGSAVAINGKAYAFVGDSGAGKSTLAAAFVHRGYPLLSDDVIAVCRLPGDARPLVQPAYPQQKLGEESLACMGLRAERYEPVPGEQSKLHVPVASRFCAEARPLAGVFELFAADNQEPVLHRFTGLERLRILMLHTYRNFLIPLLGLKQWHFSSAARLAGQIDVYQLRRPAAGFSAPLLVEQITERIARGGQDHAG